MKKQSHLLWDLDGTLIRSFDYKVGLSLAWSFWRLLETEKPLKKRAQIFWQTWNFQSEDNPTQTIYEKLFSTLKEVSGWSQEKTKEFLENFYLKEFGKLSGEFQPIPEAIEFFIKSKARYSQALLTNPILPQSCVLNKLTWTGVDANSFKFISHSQNSHFCKPDLRYFEECLSQLGVAPQDCFLIGDRKDKDGVAAKLGIEVFIVEGTASVFWKNMAKSLLDEE